MAAAYGRSLGSGTENGTDNNVVITVTANAAVGEKLVIAACALENTTMTVADSTGVNSWTANTYRLSGDFDTFFLAWANCTSALTSGVSTITATFGATVSNCIVFAAALTGADTGAPTASGISADFVDTWDTPDSTTTDGSIIWGGCVYRSGSTSANTAVRGTERHESNIGVNTLVVQTNEYATGSATSDIAGSFAVGAGVGIGAAHYAWGATATPPVTDEAALRTAHTPVTWRT